MHINWFTVAAQIINFLVLIFLLKKFLYRPIVKAMSQRQQAVVDSLENAQQMQSDADAQIKTYQEKNEALGKIFQNTLKDAREETEVKRKIWLDEIKQELKMKQQQWEKQFQQYQDSCIKDYQSTMLKSVTDLSKHVLSNLADVDLETMLVKALLKKIQHLPLPEKKSIRNKLVAAENIKVTTTFDLSSSLKDVIKTELKTLVEKDMAIDFAKSKKNICGIEIAIAGHNLNWTIDQYVNNIDQQFAQQMEND